MCFSHLLATTARALSTTQLPKVLRTRCVFASLTWTCALRHSRVHFSNISTSKSAPNIRCVSHFDFEICFATMACNFSSFSWPDGSAPAAVASVGKTQHFATFRPFRAPASFFFWLLFSFLSLSFFLLILFSLTLPTSAFPSVDIVGTLTSKLPSNIGNGWKANRKLGWQHSWPETMALSSQSSKHCNQTCFLETNPWHSEALLLR